MNNTQAFTIVELLIVVVVVAVLATISIVSYNGITNRADTAANLAELQQWKKKSEVHKFNNNITCPTDYAFVYGNAALGTSDFCVMKYEAKNVGGIATSQASGLPWVGISQANASAASIAVGGHLITEAEWMTIAADIMSVKYNWSGGAVGSGYVYQGHVNNQPGAALAASNDDNDGTFGISGGFGTTSGTNSKRTLILSSGDVIWDLSGNILEWTAGAQSMSNVGVSGDAAFNWRQWNNGSLSFGNLPAGSRPSALAATAGLGSIGSWDSTRGIGQIRANYADTASRGFVRGGVWSDLTAAGILSLSLSDAPTAVSAIIGFRVVR